MDKGTVAFLHHVTATAVLAAAVAGFAAGAFAQSSPLSRGFGAAPPFSGRMQTPSLFYYGPSYSLGYDRPPPDAGPAYHPSLRNDPFYGPNVVDRFERGRRFSPFPPWYELLQDR